MLKAILFDLFETLVTHFDPNFEPPSMSVAERIGIGEEVYRQHWKPLDDRWQMGHFDSRGQFIALYDAVGLSPDMSLIDALIGEREAIGLRALRNVYPEIVALLRELQSRGLRLGIATNVGDMELETWPQCEIAPYFEVVVPSFEVGLLKPDQRIFEHALNLMGVDGDETIFVGDGGWNELAGATSAGMTAYWATWFLDKWPAAVRPGRFDGDEWRQNPEGGPPPYPRLRRPSDLLNVISPST